MLGNITHMLWYRNKASEEAMFKENKSLYFHYRVEIAELEGMSGWERM